MTTKNNKDKIRIIALERMSILFKLGIIAVKNHDYDVARRYGELIYRISTRLRVKIPQSIKRWICKNCCVIMVPGLNAKIRTRRDGKTLRIITRCMVCGWIHRYEFVKHGEK
ncbi:MAG: ribonuclease P [Ignisphaera sp.]